MNSPAHALNPGDRIAEFQVERVEYVDELMATYRVVDPSLGRAFLLRECLPAASTHRDPQGELRAISEAHESQFEQARADFRSTSRLLSTLDHPNLERVLRLFDANGTTYCLLDWPAGETLATRLEAHDSLDPDTTRELLSALAAASEAIHHQGLLHLSIAPEQIYLPTDGPAVLLGFHRATRPGEAGPLSLPAHLFHAPERLQAGQTETPASDIYGFCAVAYRCLTGQPPVSAGERLRAIDSGLPDPLETVASQLDASRLGGLGDAIDMGLRLEAEERPARVTQWRQSLESIDWRRQVALEDQSEDVSERPEWLSPMLLGAFFSLLLVVVLYLVFVREPTTPTQKAEIPETELAGPAVAEEETQQWQAALQADTVLGYRRFLETYPDSSYRVQAEVQLDILDERNWAELTAEDTLPAYKHYLELFPGGLHEAEALREIEQREQALAAEERAQAERARQDGAAWREAREKQSIAALDAYLEAWPAGLHAEEARNLRTSLRTRELESRAWDAAVALNTGDAYQAYLDAYPQGEFSAEALIRLEYIDLSPGKVFRDCAQCPPMTVIPAGNFRQGSRDREPLASNNEMPWHLVNIERPFAIGVTEITFEEWDACVAEGGCSHSPPDNGWGRGKQPVIMVSWNDAQEYVDWLSEKTRQVYRLPSESEWEYAARAGQTTAWPGGTPETLCEFANIAGAETDFRWRVEDCNDGKALGTLPVGTLRPNGFKLYDVIGNVAEWTEDCMNLSYLDAPTDGSAWNRGICSSHMTRGGSWVTGMRESRLPARFNSDSGDRNDFTGFRVVREVQE